MIVPDNRLKAIFWDSMPREYLRRLLRAVADAYSRAAFACIAELEMEDTEADNTRWAIRRGLVEGAMRKILPTFPTVRAEVIRGKDCPAPNPWNHTLISCGRVLLTQCSVQHRDDFVRPSVSREIYSLPNKQKSLFAEFEDKRQTKPNENPLYGILIHGREYGTSDQLGFALIRFPVSGAEYWYSERIDLFAEFPESVAHLKGNRVVSLPPEECVDAPKDPEIHAQENAG